MTTRFINCFLFLCFFISCKTTIPAHKNEPLFSTLMISDLVKATNQRNFTRLEQLYHRDFRSLAPVIPIESKTTFLRQLKTGLSQSDQWITMEILDFQAGDQIATTELVWTIYQNAKKTEITYQHHLLQIWKKNNQQWQLLRILFYDPLPVPKF